MRITCSATTRSNGTLPILAGVCRLRAWRTDDLASLVRHANDRDVWITLRDRFPHPYTEESGRQWLESTTGASPPHTVLAVDVSGEAVGGLGIVPGGDVNRHTAEVGYWLGRTHWGQGIMTAAITAYLPWVAETFGVRRLFAEVFETNVSSMRVLEKCGFEREGVLRQHALKDGRYLDQIVYGRAL